MERRDFLKAAGGTAGAATLGGAGILAMTGGATATGSVDYGGTTITSDDGTVEYVAIFGDSIVHWDGFDTPAQYVDIEVSVEIVQKWDGQTRHGPQTVHTTGKVDLDNSSWGNHDESLSGSGTSGTIETGIGLDENGNHDETIDWHIVGTDPDGYGLPSNPVDASHLEVASDGKSRQFRLLVRSAYTWYDASENELFSETFTGSVPVTVNNEPRSASAEDGDGDDGAVGA